MKNFLITLFLAALLNLAVIAQQQSPDAIEKDTYVGGELAQTIDIAKARVGDKVTVRLDSLAAHGKIYIRPKIVGHLQEVQQSSSNNPQSRLVIVLDHLQLKGRAEEPIVAVIRYIDRPAPPVVNRVSGVPSTGNPVARAAGPMVDSYGKPLPPPSPTPRIEPMPDMPSRYWPAGSKEIQVTPNYEAHATVITGGMKLRLVKESRMNLILNGSDSNNPIK
ncbi:MAG TPA: hypothetical protein VHW72_16135 [Candidatus Angelobacter sp.]|nr:hypothetical protein [Candidatus Angelobacter sp.]